MLLIALIVDYGELWRVEKAAAVQATHRNEVSPFLASITEVEPDVGCAETAIGSGDSTLRSGHALARTCGYVDDNARLLAVFRGWCTGDDLQRLDRIKGDLVGENFALLVSNRLTINRKRVLRVIAHSVEETI